MAFDRLSTSGVRKLEIILSKRILPNVGALKKEHTDIQTKLDKLVDMLAEGVLLPEDYRFKREQYKSRQADLTDMIHHYDKADDAFGKTMEKLMKVAMGAHKAFVGSNMEEKRELLNFVFSNLQLNGSTLCYTYEFPFNKFENINTCSEWRMGWDSNPRDAYTPAGFQDRCLQPLGHPSGSLTSIWL